jgi:hypothetical protein
MKITICSIIRNQSHNLIFWYDQIKDLVNHNSEIDFSLSVYENNSSDNTKDILKSFDFSFLKNTSIILENIEDSTFYKGGYDPYGEESKKRVKLLSECRNKCFLPDWVSDCDFILFIEPDIRYNFNIFKEIYNFIINNDYDIVSAISVTGREHYDKWGTRINQKDTWCDLSHLVGSNDHFDVYSTFNCFVLYRAKPILEQNCKFKFLSDVLNTHDCDTVLICEEFRKNNHNKICILPNKIVEHFW